MNAVERYISNCKEYAPIAEAAKLANFSESTVYRRYKAKNSTIRSSDASGVILVNIEDTRNIKLKKRPNSVKSVKASSDQKKCTKKVKAPYDQKLKLLGENISRAKSRKNGEVVEIDKNYAYVIGEKQGWKCALTGVPLEFERGGQLFHRKWCNPNICVIDRIDSDRGYVEGNIQLLTHRINTFKSAFTEKELYDICELVVEARRKGLTK
jgi:hypothetical protein